MEARLCQITSSMRALVRSNKDLEEALETSPGDADFLQAIAENQLTIRRQGLVAVALVREMKARGCNAELEADIERVVTGNSEAVLIVSGGESRTADTSPSQGLFL